MRCGRAGFGAETSSIGRAVGLVVTMAAVLGIVRGARAATTQAATQATSRVAVSIGPGSRPASTGSLESTAIRVRTVAETPRAGAQPLAKDGSTAGFGFWRVSAALAVVVGAILALRWAGKRFLNLPGGGASGGAVKVLSRSTISPRQQLMLIQVGRRVVLVGNCGTQMNALCEINDAQEVAELVGMLGGARQEISVGGAFSALFGRQGKRFDEEKPEAVDEREEVAVDPELATTREEVAGLLDKVRGLARQFKRA